MLQRQVRLWLSWSAFVSSKEAAVQLLNALRSHQGSNGYESCRSSAITLRRHARGYVHRSSLRCALRNVVLIQKSVRGWLDRTQFVSMKASTLTLQRLQRRKVQERQNSLRNVHAAILLQRQVHLWLSRATFVSAKQAAVRLQNAVRARHGSKQYESCRSYAITLQLYGRGYIHRRLLRYSLWNIVLIQKHARGWIARTQFTSRKQSAVVRIVVRSLACNRAQKILKRKNALCLAKINSAAAVIQRFMACHCENIAVDLESRLTWNDGFSR